MARQHLVTGGTGFIGASCVLELLEKTDDRVVCLTRGEEPQARLHAVLSKAADLYGMPKVCQQFTDRVLAIPGDVASPSELALPSAIGPISHVWHLAASLQYRRRDADEIHRTNVDGTRALLKLSTQSGARRFVYFSTAYVAGSHSGDSLEVSQFPSEVNNEYESSKRLAEEQVLAHYNRSLDPLIIRPSIVVGHSITHGAISSMGPYGFAETVYKLRHEGPAHIRELFASRPMRIVANEATLLNFIPVDRVARAAVQLGLSDKPSNIFHLTNASGVSVRECFEGVCGILDIPFPEFVSNTDSFETIDYLLAKRIEFYAPYMMHTSTFDQTNAFAALGDTYLDCPYDRETISQLIKWFRECVLEPGAK
jgi:nucleoside-diphosphate-sugar epimerase